MIIVSDTSAITNLFLIGQIELLLELYGEVFIPNAVRDELYEIEEQAELIAQTPWVKVETPKNSYQVADLMASLDKGESEAIVLALEKEADYLIIDEKKGRTIARELGIPIIGLLGILIEAKRNGLLPEIRPVLNDLRNRANFRISPNLFHEILLLAGE